MGVPSAGSAEGGDDGRPLGENELPEVIITGVPRTGRDVPGEQFGDWPALKPDNPYERHAAHRGGDPRPASAPSPEPPDEPSEPRYVRAQVAQPTENSPGEIAEGSFTVAGGMLTVFDSDGCRLGSPRTATGRQC
jgi:hypothetical protein